MLVLGIDPGSRRTGWGVVRLEGTRLRHVGAGTIAVSVKLPLAKRLYVIHQGLQRIIADHQPETVAVEEIFFAKYPNAALKLGHARGVALLAAAEDLMHLVEHRGWKILMTQLARDSTDAYHELATVSPFDSEGILARAKRKWFSSTADRCREQHYRTTPLCN